MAEITAALVKELREMTGAGMMECKKALVEAEGELEKAVDVLRTRGLAAVAKKAGRATDEGTVLALVSECGHDGALVELNCETDFVGMNEKFRAYAEKIAKAVLANKPADLEALKASEIEGETVEAVVTDAIHTLGENIEFKLGDASFATNDDFKKYGRDVAMQVAAASPVSATRESVDPAVVEHEMSIYKAQAAESGKPENIQEKIATGRMEKFYKENCLTEQAFVKNPDQSVNEYTAEVAKALGTTIEIVSFTRFMLGE